MQFFKALTLCHTVQIGQAPMDLNKIPIDGVCYQASSPDEKALLDACCQLGFVYLGDDNDILRLKITPNDSASENTKFLEFKRLHILEFSSERKRMSVIVADEENRKWLYTKGAESAIFELCSEQSRSMISQTDSHITEFAKEGLRTLAIARRQIPEDEYDEFCNDLSEAHSSLGRRQELMTECYKRIECGKQKILRYESGSKI